MKTAKEKFEAQSQKILARESGQAQPKVSEPDEAKNIADEMPSVIARLEKMQAESKAFTEQWRKWFLPRKDNFFNCPEHKTIPLTVNENASISKSFADKKNCIVFFDCPECTWRVRAAAENLILAQAGCPEDLLHARLDNWKPENDYDRETLRHVTSFADNPRGALILLGSDFGVGKSHLAVAAMRVHTKKVNAMRFMTHTALMHKIRESYGDPRARDFIALSISTRLLCLDDLGVTSGGRDELPTLHQILDERKQGNRPFILTSNAPDARRLTEILGERMMSRLTEFIFSMRVIKGASKRKPRFTP